MSYSHSTYTFSVDPSAAPSAFASTADVQILLDAVWAEAEASDGPELRLVRGSSRKGWVLERAKTLTGALSLTGLEFLHAGGGDEELEAKNYLCKPTILRATERDEAAVQLERALHHLTTHPKFAGNLADDLHDEDAVAAFRREYGADQAAIDLNDVPDGFEGDSGEYLTAYLTSVRRILREARLNNRVVIHVCNLEGESPRRG